MAEVIFDPTPEIVTKVNKLVSPLLENPKPLQLDKMAVKFGTFYLEVESLVENRTGLLDPAMASEKEDEARFSQAQSRLQEAQKTAETTRKDLESVRYRAREEFNNAPLEILPFWLVRLKPRLRRVPNPLNPLIDTLEGLSDQLDLARTNHNKAIKKAEVELNPKIAATKSRLGAIKHDLLDIWEPPLLRDYDLSGQYANIYVGRSEDYAKSYAEVHAYDDSWQGYYLPFLGSLRRQFPEHIENQRFIDREWKKYVADSALKEWRA